ncbi:MAG: acetylornithine transaminase [Acidobacteriota bacterium]
MSEARTHDALLANYRRAPVAFVSGQGAVLTATDGKKYLDFLSGLATSSLGHGHPRLVQALQEQAARYIHVSNLYEIPEQSRAAELLVAASKRHGGPGLDRVFFCNSGAEANEAAIKLARKWGGAQDKSAIVSTVGGFHGRTMGALAATGTPQYQEAFKPLPGGFRSVPLNDIEAMKDAVDPATCAVLLEPIQGEAGVLPADPGYLAEVQALCRERGALFILDEVQTGIGRTGEAFAFQREGLEPDIVALAKGMGGGVPVGAMMAREEVAKHLVPGDHGSTFGGNALSAAAVVAVLETVIDDAFLERVRVAGERMRQRIDSFAQAAGVLETRGAGLMVGLEIRGEAAPVAALCLERGLLLNAVRAQSLRLLPPLVVTDEEIDAALDVLETALVEAAGEAP